jgi:response regulator of citrate/malate metabolism
MSDGLDVLIIDDEKEVCDILSSHIEKFYTWGDVTTCTDVERALSYCRSRPGSIMIFVLDVFVGDSNGFLFLDAIAEKYPNAYHDTIMITGNANDDVVDMCVASGVNHLLEKPVKPYALQLAVRSIVSKYLKFAKMLLNDPDFAENIERI